MSRENVEVVQRMLDAFLSGDIPTALSFSDDDVEWDGTNLPDGQIGRGHSAVLDHLRRWTAQWAEWTVEVDRIIDAGGEHVVVFVREKGRSRSGLTMDELHAELYSLRDAKIVRRQGFSDPNEALKAAGLRTSASME